MIYLPFIPVTIGALLEAFGIHGALTLGIAASTVVMAIGTIVMVWQVGGRLAALGAVAFASIITLGFNAATRHDASLERDIFSGRASHDRRD